MKNGSILNKGRGFYSIFFQPYTMVRFTNFCLFLIDLIAHNINKIHLFLVIS